MNAPRNNYRFSTVTMVTRTRLSLTLHVHCLLTLHTIQDKTLHYTDDGDKQDQFKKKVWAGRAGILDAELMKMT